jgi:hypothetical protein
VLTVVALVPLVSGVLGLAAPAAHADPDCVYVWLVHQDGSHSYVVNRCVSTGWLILSDPGYEHTEPQPIVWDITGAGVQVSLTAPV